MSSPSSPSVPIEEKNVVIPSWSKLVPFLLQQNPTLFSERDTSLQTEFEIYNNLKEYHCICSCLRQYALVQEMEENGSLKFKKTKLIKKTKDDIGTFIADTLALYKTRIQQGEKELKAMRVHYQFEKSNMRVHPSKFYDHIVTPFQTTQPGNGYLPENMKRYPGLSIPAN